MHQSTMRVVGLAAALLAATAAAVPVQCGAIDALWQDEAAVVGNFPECESYYDNTKPEQTAELDPEHPEVNRLALCSHGQDAGDFKCPGADKREELEARINPIVVCRRGVRPVGFKCSGAGRRNGPPWGIGNKPPIYQNAASADNEKRLPPAIGNKPPIFQGNAPSTENEKRSAPPVIGNKPPIFQDVEVTGDEKRGEQHVEGNWPPDKRGNWPPHVKAEVTSDATTSASEAGPPGGNWPPHKRAEESTEGNWPPHKRSEQNVEGNWPPHKRSEQNVEGNWPPHKRAGQSTEGNWPPRIKAEATEDDAAAGPPSGNWPPHKRSEQNVEGNWPPHKRGNWPPHVKPEAAEAATAGPPSGNWPPHKRGNWPPHVETEGDTNHDLEEESSGRGGNLCGLLDCEGEGDGPIGTLKDPGHAGNGKRADGEDHDQ